MSLRRFDAALDEQVPVIVIGGSALALAYGVAAATGDVDTYESRTDLLAAAAEAARRATGLRVPITNRGIAQFPPGYDQRLVPVLPQLTRLEVRVLDAHDLAAGKLLRGTEHDCQQLGALHDVNPLDLPTCAPASTRCWPATSAIPPSPDGRYSTSSRRSGASSRRSRSTRGLEPAGDDDRDERAVASPVSLHMRVGGSGRWHCASTRRWSSLAT
jgi:hypothetical protein